MFSAQKEMVALLRETGELDGDPAAHHATR